MVGNVVEAAPDISLDCPEVRRLFGRLASLRFPWKEQRLQVRDCAVHGLAWPEAVRSEVEPRFEDWLQDVLHRGLYHPIFHGRYSQMAKLPWFTNFGNRHSPCRLRSECSVSEFRTQ